MRGDRRRWSLTVGAALAVLAMATPAQGDPFAYVTDSASYDVSQYEIAAGGILAPLSPPTVGADASPIGVAVARVLGEQGAGAESRGGRRDP